ncbi:MAG TPA: YciI family protein [Micromonosporaceae bacterium]|nr:YciI family protein [Micromonosporaceae bacterium]
MPRYMLIVDYQSGVVETPMDEWKPEEIAAHMEYYREQLKEIRDSGELVSDEALTGLEYAKVVTSDGGAPVVTDGPFAEFKEMLAGYQLVDVESEARALEIAAKISAVPGPGGVPLQQPITVRRAMDAADFEALLSP